MSDARLQSFAIEREINELRDRDDVIAQIVTPAATEGLTETERDDLEGELRELLTTRLENLERLRSSLSDYTTAVVNLETLEGDLIEKVDELASILAKRLLWTPNTEPLNGEFIIGLPRDLAYLLSPQRWREVVSVLRSDFEELFSAYALIGLAALSVLGARRRIVAQLHVVAQRVGRVREDGILLTIEAFLLQLVNTLPLAAVLAFIGYRLSTLTEATDFAKAVGTGILAAAIVGFSLQLLRNLCRRNGIARAHFRWSERTGKLVRRHLLWYMVPALPASFIVGLTQEQPDPLLRYGLGRLAFIVLMIAAAVLAYFLLHPTRGLFVGLAVERSSAWLRRTRPAWLTVGVLVPLALAAMAIAGYYYAALQLEYRLNHSLLILVSAVFLHALCLRWLMISQRRLALKVALEKRAALAKKTEAGEVEEAAAAEGLIETLEQIDVEEIQDQTQDLLRVSVGIYFVVATWFAWVGVLPALGVLDEFKLYQTATDQSITLGSVGLALLVVVITITAARNMPGFLEIALLQRLPLEPGVRYATRTLILYTIVTTGIIVAFNSIGVGWSSVQWLVAALTVGLGFGLQEIFANFVSGLIILLERPIRVGDTVTVGDVSGVVTRIRMRATTITDWSRRELVVPNKRFITNELINWSLSDPILRLEMLVGIAYGSDTTLAHRTMLEVCRSHPMVLEQPEPNVFFTGFGDNSLNFEVRVFVSEPTNTGRSRIVHDLHMAIDKACRENDITIAFPQRDLHFKSSEGVLRVAFEDVTQRFPKNPAEPGYTTP